MAKKSQRYKVENGVHVIEVRVKSALQLFDARDPAPFRERDLDDDFAEYILSSAEELSTSQFLKVLIYVTDAGTERMEKKEIADAIHAHFSYQHELKRKQLTKLFRTGQLFLLIGLIGLFACLGLANLISTPTETVSSEPLRILREGLVILGWVAMWKPFELVLFDWWPMYDRMRLFRKMENTEIEVKYDSK